MPRKNGRWSKKPREGRICKDITVENGHNLWIVADNARNGAALNAVQIAGQLVANNLVRVP